MKSSRIITLFALILTAGLLSTGCIAETGSEESIGASITEMDRAPGQFEIFRGQDGKYYFHLKAANGEIVLQSQSYTRKASAQNGVESVLSNGVDRSHFVLLQASNGQWYFNLRARNYRVIGTSELYTSKYNADRGAETVRSIVAGINRYDAQINGGARFELLDGTDGQHYFHLRASNGEIVLASEGYVTEAGALGGIESVRANGKDADNYDILPASNGQWYFNLVAQNGETIGTSELYVSKYNAERGAETVADMLYSERVADAE